MLTSLRGRTRGWYYDTYLQRFLQPDSLMPDWYTPQYLNRYSYVRNNPLRYTDPTGHMEVDVNEGTPVTGCYASGACQQVINPPANTGGDQEPGESGGGGNPGGPKDTETRFDEWRWCTTNPLSNAFDNLLYGAFRPAKRGAMMGWALSRLFVGSDRERAMSDTAEIVYGNLQSAVFSATTAPVPEFPPVGPGIIYRGGSLTDNNLTPRPSDLGELSFRDSLSNPWPLPEGQRPVLQPGEKYFAVDTAKLPAGSVVYDNNPAGHVGVLNLPPGAIRDAIIFWGKFSK